MYTAKQREYYNQDRDRACEALGITVNQYNSFRRYGQKLHKIYENNCNGFLDDRGNWSDELEQASEREEQVITDEVTATAKGLGLEIFFQTDPRGATIYLDNKEIPRNSYNNSHCIY